MYNYIKIFCIFVVGLGWGNCQLKADVLTVAPFSFSTSNNISTMEIFISVPGYEGLYEASNLGRIIGLKYKKILKTWAATGGYQYVKLSKNGKLKSMSIHKIVHMTFYGVHSDGFDIDHIDNNRLNNNINNLQLLTRRQNISKGVLTRSKSSQYVGVRLNRGKWESQIRIGKNRKYLGRFNSEYEAHLAYQSELNNINL
jgi:hypothetical protein